MLLVLLVLVLYRATPRQRDKLASSSCAEPAYQPVTGWLPADTRSPACLPICSVCEYVCATQTLREDAGGKKSVGGARDRDNGELRFSLRSIQVRQTDVLLWVARPFNFILRQNRRHFAKTGSGQTSEIVFV